MGHGTAWQRKADWEASLGPPEAHREAANRGADVCREEERLFHPSESHVERLYCGSFPRCRRQGNTTHCPLLPSCPWTQASGPRCPLPRLCFQRPGAQTPGVVSQSRETGAALTMLPDAKDLLPALEGPSGRGTQILPDLVATSHCPDQESGWRLDWVGQAP